ncbi:MAG: TspO/MBR family protein [Oscillospiraceae bacterium]|nr:TspO/MBR family protein [Oscillospiraceae bacterium]
MRTDWKKLIISIAIPLAVGGLSALLTKDSMILFEAIRKPPLSPPSWVFPVVWSILYILMGIAAYYVWVSDKPKRKKELAFVYYAIQLAFNFGWCIIFFDIAEYLPAFIWLCMLWFFILLTMTQFFSIDKKSGWLMLPYLLWVAFAGYLNYGVYMLNK